MADTPGREAIAQPCGKAGKNRAKENEGETEAAERERVAGHATLTFTQRVPAPLSRFAGEGESCGLAVGGADGGGAGFGGGFVVAGAALAGDEIELGLGLFEAEADPLLVQMPHVAADGGVDEAKLVELVGDGTDAQSDFPMELVVLVDSLAEALVALLGRLAEFGELGVGRLPDVLQAIDQDLVSLDRLGVETTDVLAEPRIDLAQLGKRRIDVDE